MYPPTYDTLSQHMNLCFTIINHLINSLIMSYHTLSKFFSYPIFTHRLFCIAVSLLDSHNRALFCPHSLTHQVNGKQINPFTSIFKPLVPSFYLLSFRPYFLLSSFVPDFFSTSKLLSLRPFFCLSFQFFISYVFIFVLY